MRLLLTGKTRSGKSTTLHRFLSHALRQRWLDVLLLDGKGTKLSLYGDLPSVDYFGPDEIEAWLERLEDAAANLTTRFADLVNRDLEVAPDDELRQLIVVDEVQRGTRAKNGIGPKIKEALALIAEQSGALNDVLVVASQRGPGAIPPGVRHNCNANIQMLGKGYFFYRADGQPTRSGRAAHIEAEAAASMAAEAEPDGLRVDPANLPAILGTIEVEPTRAPAKLYLGKPGSGKTWALKELHVERVNGYERFLYVDLAQPHRSVLSELIESAGATVPARVPIPDLAEIAALSIQAEPTLLLLDNLHAAAPKVRPSIERLMIGAASVGLSANEPRTPTDTRRLKPFVARCSVEELKPLRNEAAAELLWSVLEREAMERPKKVEKKLIREAQGNPKAIVDLARRIQRGDAAELRRIQTPVRRMNIGWIVLVAIVAAALVSRRIVDSYVALGIVTALALVLRPLIGRMMFSGDDD